MSKKKAVDYRLTYLRENRPYVIIEFLDKKGRTMMSSVDVVLNAAYLTDGEGDWDYNRLAGFVQAR